MDQSKDMRKLSRADLLELLVEMSRENDRLKEELDQAREQLASRELKLKEAGTMAEAALLLNGVFEAADAACREYLESVKSQDVIFSEPASSQTDAQTEAERIIAEAKENAQKTLNRARKKARKILGSAKEEADALREEAREELRKAKKKNK